MQTQAPSIVRMTIPLPKQHGDVNKRARKRILSHDIHEEVEPHDGHGHPEDWNLIEFCRGREETIMPAEHLNLSSFE